MLNRLLKWWADFREEMRNSQVCERMDKGYECKNRKCLGRVPH